MPRTRTRRSFVAITAAALAAGLLGACSDTTAASAPEAAGTAYDLSPAQSQRVRAAKVDAIAAKVPAAIRDRGTLIATGAAGAAPPLRFYATDDRTVVGSEVDFTYLVADILGLKVDLQVADWSQNFVRVDSGQTDVFISNVTVTEERKEKYDFATYRLDNVALEIPKAATWRYESRKDLAGKKIGVGSGTNQEQLLVGWNEKNKAEGLPAIEIAYFQQTTDYYLALASGRLDGFLGPNPSATYHAATANQTKVVGTFSGAGEALQGEIAVLTKKDNGLITAINEALNHAIRNGDYRKVIDRWGLQSEAVATSVINPPGLPKKK